LAKFLSLFFVIVSTNGAQLKYRKINRGKKARVNGERRE